MNRQKSGIVPKTALAENRQMAYKIIWENSTPQSAFLAEIVGMDCYTFQIAPYNDRKRSNHYFDLKALKALQTKLNKYLKEQGE